MVILLNAERAYQWLADQQLADGSWWAAYKDNVVEKKDRRETNFVAYVATGVWHHYLISQDNDFIQRLMAGGRRGHSICDCPAAR